MSFCGQNTPHIWITILESVQTKKDFKNCLLAFPELRSLVLAKPKLIQNMNRRCLIRDWIWRSPYVKISFRVPKSLQKSEKNYLGIVIYRADNIVI